MKIEKLVLKNFAAIEMAMHTRRIEIDFSEMENQICLLVGPNGGGKTTIMSLLTPFATVGNLDVRNDYALILPDEQGEKEITIVANGHEYYIHHYYTPQKDKNHSIKSYITKDGLELNPNGNVTSFKEIVSIELTVEMEYLKLIRLGPNVKSLISLSETERKNFMAKLLDDLGIYLSWYKNISGKERQLNDLIRVTISNMDKLNILSLEDQDKEIQLFREMKASEELNYTRYIQQKAISDHIIDSIDDPAALKSNVSSLRRKRDRMSQIIESADSLESQDPAFYENGIEVLRTKIRENDQRIELLRGKMVQLKEDRDEYRLSKREAETDLEKEIASDKELEKMEAERDRLKLSIQHIDDVIGDAKYKIELNELTAFIVFLKNISQTLSTAYSFGKKPVRKIVELLRAGKNVNSFIEAHAFVAHENDASKIIMQRLFQALPNYDAFDEKDKNESCKNCSLKGFYTTIYNILHTDQDSEEITVSDLQYIEYAWSSIHHVLLSFSTYKDTILALPENYQKYFSTDYMLQQFYDQLPIYDEGAFNDLLSVVTEISNRNEDQKRLEELERSIQRFASISNLEFVRNRLISVNQRLERIQNDLDSYTCEVNDLQEENGEFGKTLESYLEYFTTFTSYQSLCDTYEESYLLLTSYETNEQESRRLNSAIKQSKLTIESYEQKIQTLISSKDAFIDYRKHLSRYRKIYDDLEVMKKSLSSKKGIPLRYMTKYIGDTAGITNELLNTVYGDQVYLDKFEITENSFAMPFYNRGKRINDVRYASQGELSFLTVALSFALAAQTLQSYNIMLLDEPDGPLDVENRRKFIPILENQMERVSAEQCFLITHNEEFSSYPVTILDVSFGKYDMSKYKYAQIIPIKRD